MDHESDEERTDNPFDEVPDGTWLLEVKGEPSRLRFVAHVLKHSRILQLIEIDERFYLHSENLASVREAGDAFEQARADLRTLRGLLVVEEIDVELEAAGLAETEVGRSPKQYIFCHEPIVGRGKFGFARVRGGESPGPTPRQKRISRGVARAFGTRDAAIALRIMARDELDWYDVYKIVEIMERNDAHPVNRGWTTGKQLKRLEQTAQSHEAVGVAARHAPGVVSAPRRPIQLAKARELLQSWLKAWLTAP